MKKILLVLPKPNLDTEINYSYHFPLGLGYISSILKKNGHDVDCLNLNHHKGSIEEIINMSLNKKQYDFVCLGGTCLDYLTIKEIIKSIRKNKSKPRILLGGLIIVTEPKLIFNLLKPDYAIIGEAEIPILEFFENKNPKEIKGLMFKKGNEIIYNGLSEVVNDLDTIPFPDFEGFEYDNVLNNLHSNSSFGYSIVDYPRVYSILGSRGCPFNCTFCFHYSKYRKRSIDNIMKELEFAVRKYKINIINFYDECLAIDKNRLLEVCKRIKKLSEEVGWKINWIPQLTVHNIDPDTLKIMKDSGVNLISYGFESMSPIVLKSMNKPITPQMIEKTFKETLNEKIGVQANFIFGDIAETKETAKTTLDWWKKNSNGQINLGFIVPYLGSQDYKYCIKNNIIKNKKDYIERDMNPSLKLNMTSMDLKEFSQLKKNVLNATSKFCKFIAPRLKKVNEDYEITIKCPYCNKTHTYKNVILKTKFMNKWNFGFRLICRNCFHSFYCVSDLKKIGYKFYPLLRKFRDYQLKKSKIKAKSKIK